MRIHFTSRNAAFFVAGGLLIALFVSGAAHAITDTVFKYSTPKTGHLPIPAAAFVPFDSGVGAIVGSLNIAPKTNTTTCFVAPINLPNGAKMEVLGFWYTKPNGTGLSTLLSRQTLSDGSLQEVLSKIPADTGAIRRGVNYNIGAAFQTVDNALYHYTLTVCMNSVSSVFYGARIGYLYTNAGD